MYFRSACIYKLLHDVQEISSMKIPFALVQKSRYRQRGEAQLEIQLTLLLAN